MQRTLLNHRATTQPPCDHRVAAARRLSVRAVLGELEQLRQQGMTVVDAVERLKAAHALRSGDPSVNTHLHEALDQQFAAILRGEAL
jgi:hypothetical protein